MPLPSITRPKGIVGTKLSEAFHAVFSFGKSGDVSTGRGAGIAKPSKPLRISVNPSPAKPASRLERGSSADQRLDHAPQHRRIRAGIGTDAMAARDHLDPADADLRGWLAAGAGSATGTTKVGRGGSTAACSSSRASRRQRNSRLEWRPCRRATADTEAVVCRASARIARFSAADQDRRVPATTTCGGVIGPDMVPIQP